MIDTHHVFLLILALAEALIYLEESIDYEKAGVIAAIAGVVVNIVLVAFIIRFNLRQLRTTEKSVDVAYKTLSLTHYTRIEVDHVQPVITDNDQGIPRCFFRFTIRANIPTQISEVRWLWRKGFPPSGNSKGNDHIFYQSKPIVTSSRKEAVSFFIPGPLDSGDITIVVKYEDPVSEETRRHPVQFSFLPNPNTSGHPYEVRKW